MSQPAARLEGMELSGGWKVGRLETRSPLATGGNFSQCYKAVHLDGRNGFVKALDFSSAFTKGADQAQLAQKIAELFNYEAALLEFCESKHMDRVVRAIAKGTADVDNSTLGQVPYLIFEAADRDVRSQLDDPTLGVGLTWRLRLLHHISTGLKQLHSADVVHQDLKPSNVLVFVSQDEKDIAKIADLGRASRSGTYSPFDHMAWAGDPNYAPPEVYYSYIDPDWHKRRIAYDLYLLGSLVSFMFTRTTGSATLFQALPNPFWPSVWGGDFEMVLPYLRHSFQIACSSFSSQLPPTLATDLASVYAQLCEPDPRKRGYPGQILSKISLERYITKFDVMARKAEIGHYGAR